MSRTLVLQFAAAIFALTVAASVPAKADCEFTAAQPQIPDGKTATRDQMIAAQQALQAYADKLSAYQKCLDAKIQGASVLVLPEAKKSWQQQADSAGNLAYQVADRYSAQMKIYEIIHKEKIGGK